MTQSHPSREDTGAQTNESTDRDVSPEQMCGEIVLDTTETPSEWVSQEELANEICRREGAEPWTAHQMIEKALLAEVLVPAGEDTLCLNPQLFGMTWAEWGEDQ